MATTCVLGHAWSEGTVLCPTCGFGRRNLPDAEAPQPVRARHAAPAHQTVAAAVAAPLVQPTAAAVPAMATVGAPAPAQPELILSPDGQWAWNGLSWVPAIPPPPSADETAELAPVPDAGVDVAPRGGHRRAPSEHRVDPRLLFGGVLLVAALVAGDLALGLPPLGHQATAAPPPVVAHHPSPAAAHDAAARASLASGAKAEAVYRAKSGLYTSTAADLQTAGMPAVVAPTSFSAVGHHGTGFCLVAGATGNRFFLYDSVKGGVQPTVYPSHAAAAKGCSQTG